MKRRDFLKISASSGLLLAIGLPVRAEVRDTLTTNAAFAPNAFLRIDRAGKVTFVSPMIEMGQGTYTSLPMLIAEELEVDVDKVAIEHAPADDKVYVNPAIGVQMTGASKSIRGFLRPAAPSRCNGAHHAGDGGRAALEGRPVHLWRREWHRRALCERAQA